MDLRRAAVSVADIAINFAAPYFVYVLLRPAHGDVAALLAATLPPIAWGLATFAWQRHVDALSMIALGGIALSLLAFVGSGSARMLQLRENLAGAVIALVFLGSAAIGRPLIYQLIAATLRRRSASEAAAFEARRQIPGFRRAMTFMTLVWGIGLLIQTGLAVALLFTVSIATYLLVSPILNYGTFGGLMLWTILYGRHRRRLAAAADRAAAAAP